MPLVLITIFRGRKCHLLGTRCNSNCFEYSQKAKELRAGLTEIERVVYGALRCFQSGKISDLEELTRWDDDYANAMREVYKHFAEDYDVCALTAEALIVRTLGNFGICRTEFLRRERIPRKQKLSRLHQAD